jgi:hypothetical protein
VLTDFEYAVVLHADQFGSSLETPVVLLQGGTEKWGSVWFGVSVPGGPANRNLLSRSLTTGIVFAPVSVVNVRHHPGGDLTGIATADWRISWSGYLTAATLAVGELDSPGSVEGLALLPATPNPLTSQTEIHFALPADGHVTLRIVDVKGRVVRILTDSVLGAGEHALAWDARDKAGQAVPSGVYFVDLAMGAKRTARKAIVLE